MAQERVCVWCQNTGAELLENTLLPPVPLEIPTDVCVVHVTDKAVRLRNFSHHQMARGVDACITRAPLVAVAQTQLPKSHFDHLFT
jgi:hypothetical protein